MSPRFNNFLPFIYNHENVYNKRHQVVPENDPSDPGGLTKYGIDMASNPHVDVANLTEPQAREIYWNEWQACGAEGMAAGLGECVFNCAVNCGAGRVAKIMAGGCETGDLFLDRQEDFYRRLAAKRAKAKKYLKGWLNRTADLRKFLKLP